LELSQGGKRIYLNELDLGRWFFAACSRHNR